LVRVIIVDSTGQADQIQHLFDFGPPGGGATDFMDPQR
jgi:hypothetical protein